MLYKHARNIRVQLISNVQFRNSLAGTLEYAVITPLLKFWYVTSKRLEAAAAESMCHRLHIETPFHVRKDEVYGRVFAAFFGDIWVLYTGPFYFSFVECSLQRNRRKFHQSASHSCTLLQRYQLGSFLLSLLHPISAPTRLALIKRVQVRIFIIESSLENTSFCHNGQRILL